MSLLEKKAKEQCRLREQAEKEAMQFRQAGSPFPASESRDVQAARQALERYDSV